MLLLWSRDDTFFLISWLFLDSLFWFSPIFKILSYEVVNHKTYEMDGQCIQKTTFNPFMTETVII